MAITVSPQNFSSEVFFLVTAKVFSLECLVVYGIYLYSQTFSGIIWYCSITIVFTEIKPASLEFLDSVEDMLFTPTTLGELSTYDPVVALSSNSSKLFVTTDLVGVEVKNFAWSVGILSLPLIGVASGTFDRLAGTASDDFGCGDENTKPMLIIPTFLTAAILKDGTAKSYYKKNNLAR